MIQELNGSRIRSAILADARIPVMATRLVGSTQDPVAPVDHVAASSLWQLLLEPLENSFRTTRQLILVPSGILRAVPFEALLTSDDSNEQIEARVGNRRPHYISASG